MKQIQILDNIAGGILDMTVDFQPNSATIEFHITADASNSDLNFAAGVYSSLTGQELQESKNIFLKQQETAIKENRTTQVSIYSYY